MATSNHPKTFADLYGALLSNVRADSAKTGIVDQAKRMINTGLHEMHISNGEHFSWSHRRDHLVTHPQYTEGSIAVSKGGTAVVGKHTLWATVNDFGESNVRPGGRLAIAGSPNVHEVTVVTDDTNLTITPLFVGEDVSDGDYVYFEDEYTLASDFLRPIDFRFFDQNREIVLIGERKFRARFPRNNVPGRPIAATIIDAPFSGDAERVRSAILHSPPIEAFVIPYSYVTTNLAVSSAGVEATELSADTDEPIVPLMYRMAIVYKAEAQWYMARRNDPARSQAAEVLYQQSVGKLLLDQETGGDLPRLQPVRGPYVSRAARPFRGRGTSRHTTGSRFDEIRD